jgi:hypothetical protein
MSIGYLQIVVACMERAGVLEGRELERDPITATIKRIDLFTAGIN